MKKGIFFVLLFFLLLKISSANLLANLDTEITFCPNRSLSYIFELGEDPAEDFRYDIYPKQYFFIDRIEGKKMQIFSKIFDNKDKKFFSARLSFFNDGQVYEISINFSVGREEFCLAEKKEKECQKKEACLEWTVCQKLDKVLLNSFLDKDLFNVLKESCRKNNWEEKNCGFQTRDCFFIEKCLNESLEMQRIRECYFTVNPSCSDGIKNCHDGGCEFLVDCGGPCESCPNCFDGIKNNNEQGIDCGGNCKKACIIKENNLKSGSIKYLIFGIVLVLIIIAALKLVRVYKKEKELSEVEIRRKQDELS